MIPRSLRGRTVGSAVLAIALAVAGLGLAVAILVARDLRGSLDTALRERAVEVSRLSVSAPALLTAPGALGAPLGGRDLAVEVLDRRGRILSRRKTRVSARVQRRIVTAIKRARHLALLPYTADQTRIVRRRR